MSELIEKIKNKDAVICVIGLGYVGLPLCVEICKAGYRVIGIDLSKEKVQSLINAKSYIVDIPDEEVKRCIENKRLVPTTRYRQLSQADIIIICVPTPLEQMQSPDVSCIKNAVNRIKKHIKKETLIMLESTVYPGATEELIEKQLEQIGYKVEEDYYLVFSPERVDPSNRKYNVKNTPKVIGGKTQKSTDVACLFYQNVIDKVVPVSTIRAAEMCKLLENTFRSVNIAFVNELALMCDRMGIDVWEVIEAASSKPFGFMAFYPGPGIGGHCIPLDPVYLSSKAKSYDFYSSFIEISQKTNRNMPYYIVNKISRVLNLSCKSIKNSNILLLGMAYKKDIDDLRESPSLVIYELLLQAGCKVDYCDPHVNHFLDKSGQKVSSVDIYTVDMGKYDCVVLLTDHSCFNYEYISSNASCIVDTRNAFKSYDSKNIYLIGV